MTRIDNAINSYEPWDHKKSLSQESEMFINTCLKQEQPNQLNSKSCGQTYASYCETCMVVHLEFQMRIVSKRSLMLTNVLQGFRIGGRILILCNHVNSEGESRQRSGDDEGIEMVVLFETA
ncbi:unnamed protein product [Euphydryas editha]|uniref:Uncharacterized protein n=1 Tax=Euphydryas editha TaxID=104508 RepID=A0AAU9TIJ8_EUPED|nr:unnamed protein product [Euphydryas editha]